MNQSEQLDSASNSPNRSWREAFLIYKNPRIIAMLFLGFSAGLPYILIFWTLSTWLREGGVSRTAIGYISWVGITFSIKVLWSPIIDRVAIPFMTRRFGRRRGWMLLAQVGISLGILGMAFLNPYEDLSIVAWLALLVAFSSATQDISMDAYRIEAVEKSLQAGMAASYIGGYRIAAITGGAGALYIADYISWPTAFLSMAILMGVGITTTLLVKEPESNNHNDDYLKEQRVINYLQGSKQPDQLREKISAWFIGAVVCPFVDFFSRNGKYAILILLLISIYRISDITLGVMANTFYIDMGFSKTEIADISKIFGVLMTLTGVALGGVLVAKFNIMKPLIFGAISTAIINLLFTHVATQGHDTLLLALVIMADNLSAGIATTAYIAYLSSLTSTAYTATQYALFSSLMTLVPKFIGGFSGMIVDAQGYIFFFCYASIIGLPSIILVYYLLIRNIQNGPNKIDQHHAA